MITTVSPKYLANKLDKSIENFENLTEINLAYTKYKLSGKIEIKDFPNLKVLILQGNLIENISIDKISRKNLKKIDLGMNSLKNLDFLNDLDKNLIEWISFKNNGLEIDLSSFKDFSKLDHLDLSNSIPNQEVQFNKITDSFPKDTVKLKSINYLNLENTSLFMFGKFNDKEEGIIDSNDAKNNCDLSDSADNKSQSFQEESDINKSDNNYGFFSNFYHFISNYIAIMFSFLLIWWWKLIIFSIILIFIYKIFFSKIIRRKFTIRPILDTVREVIPSKIYDIKSPRYNEEFWTIRCLNNTFRVYQDVIEDKKFLNSISNGTILGRQYIFIIKKGIRGKQIIRAEEFY